MKKKKIRYIAAILALFTAAGLSSCAVKQQIVESKGYKTPEKAVEAYLDGFKKMDLQQMMETFAIDNYVDNYDFEGRLDHVKMYTYNQEIKLPNATTLARDLNVEGRRSYISASILRQYANLAGLGFNLVETQSLSGEGQPAEFAAQFAKKLEKVKTDTIELKGFIPPEDLSKYYAIDKNQENMAKLANIYGADEIRSCAAVFKIGVKEYLMCVDAVNYGDQWHILDLGGNIGSMLAVDAMGGGLLPLSELELETDWEELMVPVS